MLKDRLKNLREDRGISQAELAERLDLSAGAIGGYENGSRTPKPRILEELAEYFDVTPAFLEHGPQLSPDQYDVFKKRMTDALDHTSNDDLEAMEIPERAVRAALKQSLPIREDRARDLAEPFGINMDTIMSIKTDNGVQELLIENLKTATSDQLRRLSKYYELIKKGEL